MGRLRTRIGRPGSLVQTQVTELIYLYVPLNRVMGLAVRKIYLHIYGTIDKTISTGIGGTKITKDHDQY